jgi:glycosyltransferase involved in cell wall biosynthesis
MSRAAGERPRVVYLTADWPWPPTSGGRLQAAHLAEGLRETHDVIVLAADRTDERFPAWSEAVRVIQGRRASQLRRVEDAVSALAGGRQVLLQRMLRSRAPQAFGMVLDAIRPEFVILGRPFFDAFVGAVLTRHLPLAIEANEDLLRVSRSIVRHGATARARLVAAVDSLVVGRMQRRNYHRAAQVIVCSPVEADILGRAARIDRLAVVPNVVSIGPPPGSPGAITSLGFLGSYGYAPNETAALELMTEILPRVAALGGPDRAVLIGRDPTARMRRAAEAHPGARITGEVADPIAELRDAGILVVPLRSGAGTRVKILEAAAAGIPIVSTPFGVEGLALRHDVEVLLAHSPDALAAAVMRLHHDPPLRRRLSAAARDTVERLYSIEAGRRAMRAALAPVSPALQSLVEEARLGPAIPRGQSR